MYSIEGRRYARGKGYYDLALIQPQRVGKTLLVRSWGNPKYGEKSSFWLDMPGRNLDTYNKRVSACLDDKYQLVKAESVSGSLDTLLEDRALDWVFSAAREPGDFTKMKGFFEAVEVAIAPSPNDWTLAGNAAIQSLDRRLEATATMLANRLAGIESAPVSDPAPLVPSQAPRESLVIQGFGDWA